MGKNYLISSSCGYGSTALTSFDNALLCSGIANYNLVKISSILPPNAVRQEMIDLPEGSIIHTAYACLSSNQKDVVFSAAIAVGIPKDKTKIGVIMEFSDYCDKLYAEKCAKKMVEEAMQNRGYEIEEILCVSSEASCDGTEFISVIAAISIW